jgi:hypothetical protein
MAAALLAETTTACNLILGDHQIFGEDRTSCSEDADCDDDERCSEDEICRERCDNGAGGGALECLQEGVTGFRHCTDDDTCTEPIGTWCDYEDYDGAAQCGGYAGSVQCTNEDAAGDETPGYCTGACREPALDCPAGFECVSNTCRCIPDESCPECP